MWIKCFFLLTIKQLNDFFCSYKIQMLFCCKHILLKSQARSESSQTSSFQFSLSCVLIIIILIIHQQGIMLNLFIIFDLFEIKCEWRGKKTVGQQNNSFGYLKRILKNKGRLSIKICFTALNKDTALLVAWGLILSLPSPLCATEQRFNQLSRLKKLTLSNKLIYDKRYMLSGKHYFDFFVGLDAIKASHTHTHNGIGAHRTMRK